MKFTDMGYCDYCASSDVLITDMKRCEICTALKATGEDEELTMADLSRAVRYIVTQLGKIGSQGVV